MNVKLKRRGLRLKGCLFCCNIFVLVLFFIPIHFLANLSGYRTLYMHLQPKEGWEDGVSRNASLYISPDNITTIINKRNIPSDLFLEIIVFSAPSNFKNRKTIRETWATLKTDSDNVTFLLGRTNDSIFDAEIRKESELYNDIIQEDFVDSYSNLTIKALMMLKWMLHFSSARFLMKVDDDVYLNVPSLSETLRSVAGDDTILVGTLACKARAIRRPLHKWYCPFYLYNATFYPKYLLGPGYAMSRDVVSKLFRAALETPILHLEDVYITGICARTAHVKPLHHIAFNSVRKHLSSSCDPTVIFNPHLSPGAIRKSFSYLKYCSRLSISRIHINQMNQNLTGLIFSPKCPPL